MAGTAEILAMMQKMQQPSEDTVNGQALSQAGAQFNNGGMTGVTAVLGGLMQGLGAGMQVQGKKKESARAEKVNDAMAAELARQGQLEQQQAWLDKTEAQIKGLQLSKAEREENSAAIDAAGTQYLSTGNVASLTQLMDSLPNTRKLFASSLTSQYPDAVMTGFRDVGNGQVVVEGTKPDGSRVVSGEPMPVLGVLSPDGKAKYMAAQKGTVDLQRAQIGVEKDMKDLNAGKTFIVRKADGTSSTVFGSEQDAQMAAEKLGGQVVGTTTLKSDLTGDQTGIGLTKTVTNGVQEDMIKQQDAMQRLDAIQRSYKPDYLRLQGKLQAGLSSLKDKIGELPPAEAAQLADFTNFQTETINNLNVSIKDATGASMGVQEAERLAKANPTEADGPTAFETKMNVNINRLKDSYARRAYMLKNGITDVETMAKVLPLENVRGTINRQGQELLAKYKGEGLDEAAAATKAKADLRDMFGL